MTASLGSVLCLAALVCLCYAIGSVVMRGAQTPGGLAEKFLFAVPIGMGCVSYCVLACGLLRGFRPGVFFGILSLGAVGSPFLLRDLVRHRSSASSANADRRSRVRILAGAFVAVVGVCTMVAALAPPTEWDALSYHLAGPKTYLREGRIFYIPYAHQTNFPFTLQMLYTVMLGVGSVGGAKLCHWLFGALLSLSVYTFSARHVGPRTRGVTVGVIAAVILVSTPMVIWESTVAYTDLATALFTWLSVYAAFNFSVGDRSQSDRQIWRVVSALLMGFALGTKFTVIAFWGFLLIGIVVADWRKTRRVDSSTITNALIWAAISLCIGAPWYIKTFLYTGNPTYPFLYSLFGGRYWNAENAAQYARDQGHLGIGKTAIDLLIAPWAATMLPDSAKFTEYYTFNLSPVFLGLLPLAALAGKRLSKPSAIVGLFAIGVTSFWFLSVQQTRYLLPAMPAFAIVAAEVVVLYNEKNGLVGYVATALCALAALWGLYLSAGLAFFGVYDFTGHRLNGPAWPVVSGQVTREEYLKHGLPGIAEAEFWINANTPADARVALFDLPQGFYLDREYIWAQPDHAAGLIPWDGYSGVDDWLADFKRRGYTTLLIGALDPGAADDGKRWRSLLAEAIRTGKLMPVFSAPARMGAVGPIYVQVYEIP